MKGTFTGNWKLRESRMSIWIVSCESSSCIARVNATYSSGESKNHPSSPHCNSGSTLDTDVRWKNSKITDNADSKRRNQKSAIEGCLAH